MQLPPSIRHISSQVVRGQIRVSYVDTNTKTIKVLTLFLLYAFALAFVSCLIYSCCCYCCWPYAFSFPFIKICATCGKRTCKLRQPNKCVR